MSFYGNSYYYSAETFARIVLKNSGYKKYNADTPSNYTALDSTDPIDLDAPSRASGLGIYSGNHWIKLVYSKVLGTFQIMHNIPGEASKVFVPFSKESDPPEGVIEEDNQNQILDFDDIIKIPTVKYDNMGHVADIGDAVYYKLPTDPTEDVKGRMKNIEDKMEEIIQRMIAIDGKDKDGNVDPQDKTSLKATLNTKMASLSTEVTNKVAELNSQKATVEKLDKLVDKGDLPYTQSLVSRVAILEGFHD